MGKKKKAKTKKPSGIVITRADAVFKVTWKIPGKNYYYDQDVEYRINNQTITTGKGKNKTTASVWHAVDPAAKKKKQHENNWKNKTSYTFPVKFTNSVKTKLEVRIRGYVEPDSKNKGGYCEWVVAKFDVYKPKQPSCSVAWDSENENKTTFSWSVADAGKGSHYWFNNWHTRNWYVREASGTDAYNKPIDKNGTHLVATGSYSTPESLSPYAIARIFEITAHGRRGISKVRQACHVYSTPYAVSNFKYNVAENKDGGVSVHATWVERPGRNIQVKVQNAKTKKWSTKKFPFHWHPIDYTEVEWAMASPDSGLKAPENTQGQAAIHVAPKGVSANTANGVNFKIEQLPQPNECLYLRVRTVHDKRHAETPWVRSAQLKYSLSDPSFQDPIPSQDFKSFTINATNSAEESVPDSFLIVKYKSTVTGQEPKDYGIIGIIPHGSNSVNVNVPEDVRTKDEHGFGVQAVIMKSYTEKNKKTGKVVAVPYQNVTSVVRGTSTEQANENFNLLKNELYYKSGSDYVPVGAGGQYNPSLAYYSRFKVEIVRTADGYVYKSYDIPQKFHIESNTIWQGGEVPKPPAGLEVTMDGEVCEVKWEWSWSKADGIELSWADHEDAWESTDEPSSYRIDRIRATKWRIAGLTTGTKWYIRARFLCHSGEAEIEGPWTAAEPLDLTSAPTRPILNLSKGAVTLTEKFVASWTYTSTDGTAQQNADIFEAHADGDNVLYGSYVSVKNRPNLVFDASQTYYNLVVTEDTESGVDTYNYVKVTEPVETDFYTYYVFDESRIAGTDTDSAAQSITMVALNCGWEAGRSYNLALRLKSQSGTYSEWSPLVSVNVVEPLPKPQIPTIDGLKIVTESFTPDGSEETETKEILILEKLPIEFTINGAGPEGTTMAIIERAEDYRLERPDESIFNGYEHEVVYQHRQTGEDPIRITRDDLTGSLDDGALYRLIVTVIDVNGQSAENDDTVFMVRWNHQPQPANAIVKVLPDYRVTTIEPIKPEQFEEGDTFDIYRLSVDAPELIIADGEFGTTYVDPYPAIGEYGGHRVVFKTAYGDYITNEEFVTEEGEVQQVTAQAWTDYDDDLNIPYNIIDFEGTSVELWYNVDLSNSWNKDFKETKYLGGSVVGDWNPAVSRTGTIATVAAKHLDQETIQAMRRLADYPGICHVRTIDGSSYSANVQVTENQSYSSYEIVSYSLSITRVDPQEQEGMTLLEWRNSMNIEGE